MVDKIEVFGNHLFYKNEQGIYDYDMNNHKEKKYIFSKIDKFYYDEKLFFHKEDDDLWYYIDTNKVIKDTSRVICESYDNEDEIDFEESSTAMPQLELFPTVFSLNFVNIHQQYPTGSYYTTTGGLCGCASGSDKTKRFYYNNGNNFTHHCQGFAWYTYSIVSITN